MTPIIILLWAVAILSLLGVVRVFSVNTKPASPNIQRFGGLFQFFTGFCMILFLLGVLQ